MRQESVENPTWRPSDFWSKCSSVIMIGMFSGLSRINIARICLWMLGLDNLSLKWKVPLICGTGSSRPCPGLQDALSFFMLNGKYFVKWSPCSWQMSQKHFVYTNWTSCRLMSYWQLSFECPSIKHFMHQISWLLRFNSFNDFSTISSCSSSLWSVEYVGMSSSISNWRVFVSTSS